MASKHRHIYVSRKWKALCAQVYEEETHCGICAKPVDHRYPPRHPMSRTVHHIQDLDLGGAPYDRDNVCLAHYGCNSSLGASTAAKVRAEHAKARTTRAMHGAPIHVPRGVA